MKSLLLPTWPEALRAQGLTESRTGQCHPKQCFVSVSWLSQQVFYLPCLAAAGEICNIPAACAAGGDGGDGRVEGDHRVGALYEAERGG
jgi:hypothetical protein